MTALDSKHDNMIKIKKHDFNHMITKQLPWKKLNVILLQCGIKFKDSSKQKSNHVISQDQWEMEWKGVRERKRERGWISRKKQQGRVILRMTHKKKIKIQTWNSIL